MSTNKTETVPGLGFKDKEKALETIKNLEGRDPDYQKLAIKGLIGRAKRTITLTKDKEKLQNINNAITIFNEWLINFEKNNLSKENRSYLSLDLIEILLPLKNQYEIKDEKCDEFLNAYKSVHGEYKNLRTLSSGENQPTWDIIRNIELKKLLKQNENDKIEWWKDDLPTKLHMKMILWAYSPDANKIKKNLTIFQEKFGKNLENNDNNDNDDKIKDNLNDKQISLKRKSDNENSDSSNDESPQKKKK